MKATERQISYILYLLSRTPAGAKGYLNSQHKKILGLSWREVKEFSTVERWLESLNKATASAVIKRLKNYLED